MKRIKTFTVIVLAWAIFSRILTASAETKAEMKEPNDQMVEVCRQALEAVPFVFGYDDDFGLYAYKRSYVMDCEEIIPISDDKVYSSLSGKHNSAPIAVQSGEWIYYLTASGKSQNPPAKCELVKINLDGTGRKILTGNISPDTNIIVEDDWVYYINKKDYISRIKTDGTETHRLTADKVTGSSFGIEDGCLYYAVYENSWNQNIFGYDLNEGTSYLLSDNGYYSFEYVKDEWIYYIDMNMNNLWRIRTIGADKSMVFDGELGVCTVYDVLDGWVFAEDLFGHLLQISADGSEEGRVLLNNMILEQLGIESYTNIQIIKEPNYIPVVYFQDENPLMNFWSIVAAAGKIDFYHVDGFNLTESISPPLRSVTIVSETS